MLDVSTNYSTRDVIIDELILVTSTGDRDISKIWNRINIYESISSPVITGSIDIADATNLYSTLELQGNEFITIVFYRPGENEKDLKYKKTFRVYSVTDREPMQTSQGQTYRIHFCSEEMLISNQLIISRSFKNISITDAILNICKYDLKINRSKIKNQNFEVSYGLFESIVPTYKPFEAILKLSEYAFTENESSFLFFENREGFNFLSLESMFKRNPITKLNYSTAKITEDQTTSAFANSNDISRLNFPTSFDILHNTRKPTYASKLYTLDLLTQKYRSYRYSFGDLADKNGTTARKGLIDQRGSFPVNNTTNRNNRALYQEHDTYLAYWLTNAGQNNNTWVRSKNQIITDTNIEKTLIQRETQLNLLNYTTLDCIVPANPFYSPGFVVEFDMPGFMPESKTERNTDPFHSGKYLITAVRHVMTPSQGQQTLIRLSKNSVAEPYSQYKGDKKHKDSRVL